ncbi:MAG TPA: hypothetical protein VHL80_08940 [Polyangia bacterium]|nr:hypothetical protein [Polyangia bacterium]
MMKETKTMKTTGRAALLSLALGAAALGAAAPGCGGRPATWDDFASGGQAYGLTSAVVLVDPSAARVVALGVDGSGGLTRQSLATGHDVRAAQVGPLGDKLFVLSGGHRAGLGDAQPEEAPRLTIVDGTAAPAISSDVALDGLTNPLDGLAIDPTERWAVVYAAGTSTALVTNPNELVIVDLEAAPPAVHQVTLHSFGGHPEKLIFAPELSLPAGAGHLLVVQSDQDLSLLSLDDPTKPDITVRLADAAAVTRPHPAEVVFDDGDPAKTDDARIGVRFDAQTTVMTLQLQAGTGPQGFAPTINVSDVGGVPSALAFVRNEGGLRLSALVPDLSAAVLIDPATTTTSQVMLPAGYRSLSLVTPPSTPAATAGATPAATPDVALLWNGTAAVPGVAFWDLGGGPFRSVETVGIDGVVDDVLDVPGKNDALKVLSTVGSGTAGGAFFVLDLSVRTATPLLTQAGTVTLSVSLTGARVWAFQKGGFELAATDLPSGTVRTLTVDSPASALFEIARADGAHALVVLHDGGGGVGATVFDADAPQEDERRIYGALLTEGPYAQP